MTSIRQRRTVALFAVILSTCVGTAAESQDGDWSSYDPPPGPRYDHVAIYDPNQDRMVIFRAFPAREFPAGECAVPWDSRRDDGSLAASGVYFVRVETRGMAREGKVVLTR